MAPAGAEKDAAPTLPLPLPLPDTSGAATRGTLGGRGGRGAAGAKGSGRKGAGAANPPGGSPGRLTKSTTDIEFAKCMQEASKLKEIILKQISQAVTVSENIDANPKWAWAQGGRKAELTDRVQTVKSKMSAFHKELLLNEASVLKTKYGQAQSEIEFKSFVGLRDTFIKFKEYLNGLNQATEAMAQAR